MKRGIAGNCGVCGVSWVSRVIIDEKCLLAREPASIMISTKWIILFVFTMGDKNIYLKINICGWLGPAFICEQVNRSKRLSEGESDRGAHSLNLAFTRFMLWANRSLDFWILWVKPKYQALPGHRAKRPLVLKVNIVLRLLRSSQPHPHPHKQEPIPQWQALLSQNNLPTDFQAMPID